MAYRCGHCKQAHIYADSARLCQAVEQQEEIACRIEADRDEAYGEMLRSYETDGFI